MEYDAALKNLEDEGFSWSKFREYYPLIFKDTSSNLNLFSLPNFPFYKPSLNFHPLIGVLPYKIRGNTPIAIL